MSHLYSKRDLNPHSCNSQGILSPSCLPIPPFEQPFKEKRAENEARTRDPNLGKVMLYQLSYFRVYGCKCMDFLNIFQTFHPFLFQKYALCAILIAIDIFCKSLQNNLKAFVKRYKDIRYREIIFQEASFQLSLLQQNQNLKQHCPSVPLCGHCTDFLCCLREYDAPPCCE